MFHLFLLQDTSFSLVENIGVLGPQIGVLGGYPFKRENGAQNPLYSLGEKEVVWRVRDLPGPHRAETAHGG